MDSSEIAAAGKTLSILCTLKQTIAILRFVMF
jgi:hypothetical protein